MNNITKLIFIYNAKGGLFNSITDYIHKKISPDTYECNLCAITYDNLGMKKGWKEFLNSLTVEKIFLHKEELGSQYIEYKNTPLPIIVAETESGETSILLNSKELNEIQNQDELIEEIKSHL